MLPQCNKVVNKLRILTNPVLIFELGRQLHGSVTVNPGSGSLPLHSEVCYVSRVRLQSLLCCRADPLLNSLEIRAWPLRRINESRAEQRTGGLGHLQRVKTGSGQMIHSFLWN